MLDNYLKELAIQAKSGDMHAKEQLWEQVKRLVFQKLRYYFTRYARYFLNSGITWEDLEQEGYLAFLLALKAFDADKGWAFTTWLTFPLQNRMNELLCVRSGKIKHMPLNGYISLDANQDQENNEYCLLDILEDPEAAEVFDHLENKMINAQLHQVLEDCLNHLEKRQERVIRGRYYEGKTLENISHEVSCSRSYVATLESKALRALRRGRALRQLEPFHDQIISCFAWRGTGYASWKNTGLSSVERSVEKVDRIIRNHIS